MHDYYFLLKKIVLKWSKRLMQICCCNKVFSRVLVKQRGFCVCRRRISPPLKFCLTGTQTWPSTCWTTTHPGYVARCHSLWTNVSSLFCSSPFSDVSLIPHWEFGSPCLGTAAEAARVILTIFSYVQTMVWLPVFGNVWAFNFTVAGWIVNNISQGVSI